MRRHPVALILGRLSSRRISGRDTRSYRDFLSEFIFRREKRVSHGVYLAACSSVHCAHKARPRGRSSERVMFLIQP